MYLENIENLKNYDKVSIKCDICPFEDRILLISSIRNIKTHGFYSCKKCASKKAAKSRLQNSKEYWTEEKRIEHGKIIADSEKYRESIKLSDLTGEKNPMFGKTHSEKTKTQMAKSRTGKIQSKYTIEKRANTIKEKREADIQSGKKTIKSVNYMVKYHINSVYRWTFRVLERDSFKCTECGSSENLDAHHKTPFSKIIKELLLNIKFDTDLEKYNFLIGQEKLIDINLHNGICLCRPCHKQVHLNWGSHDAKTKIKG